MSSFDTDIFVLGGGPAGLAAAIALRQAGFAVLLADAERPPIEKACGEGLMPDSLAAAARLGIHISPALGFPFRGIRFQNPEHFAAADFPAGSGIGIRRPILQGLLAERAAQTGVEMLWGQVVTGLKENAVRLGGKQITARWIVGADGVQSLVRRWAGLDHVGRDTHRFSFRRHYRVAPWSDYMEIHWGDGCQFYVTPVSASEVCLVLTSRNPRKRIANVLPEFPALARRLSGRPTVSAERGAIAGTRRLRRVTQGNVALVGDASGTVDPITGDGLCLAFQQAHVLAGALAHDDLGLYERAHRHVARRPRFMSDFMLLLDRSAMLQRRTLAAFEAHPHLFANLLSMHVGQLAPRRFLTTAAALGWQIAGVKQSA